MKLQRSSLRRKALWMFACATCLIVLIGIVTWSSFNNTLSTLRAFESEQVPDIRNVFSLSEEVAKIAALAPYIANSARPFQLQTEKVRLQKQYELAQAILQNIKNEDSKRLLSSNLMTIQDLLNELFSTTQNELYAREDALTMLFNAYRLSEHSESVVSLPLWQPLIVKLENISHVEPGRVSIEYEEVMSKKYADSGDLIAYTQRASIINEQLEELALQKSFLLASLRAHSENLTEQTNYLASLIQKDVLNQQSNVARHIVQTIILISGVLFILFLFVIVFIRYSQKLASDLAVVSDDMQLLASGKQAPSTIEINRHDEIGALVSAYYDFRNHAISADATRQQLAQQNLLLETVFNNIQDGLSVFSNGNRLIGWNDRFKSIFEIETAELYEGMPLAEVQRLMSKKTHRNIKQQKELSIEHINSQRHYDALTFERHFDSGKIVEFRSHPMPEGGFVTLYSDITEKRAADRKMQQSQKLEVLGQLTSGVAHDFNNLLAALMGNLQLLQQDALTPRSTKYVQRALNVSERGKELILRLLAFGRKQHLMPKATDVDEFIENMEDLLTYSVPTGIKLNFHLNSQHRSILTDASQLENALLNLVLNAADAIPGTGSIHVSTELREERLYIRVTDSGLGIPEELQLRVLEPFFTTKSHGRGSGLGLSTVYGFVTQSNGRFELFSKPNQGTTVVMSWETHTESVVDLPDTRTLEPIHFDTSKEVVLIEDDPEVAQAMSDWFISHQLKCRTMTNAEAFFVTTKQGFDWIGLVISDVNLAGDFNGIDVLAFLRKYAPEVPALLISGLSKDHVEADYGMSVGENFLQKPISPDVFSKLFFAQ